MSFVNHMSQWVSKEDEHDQTHIQKRKNAKIP